MPSPYLHKQSEVLRMARVLAKHPGDAVWESRLVELRRFLREGKTALEIAEFYGVGRGAIYGVCDRYRLPRPETKSRARKITDEQAAQIAAARGKHQDIAAQYGVSVATEYEIKNRLGRWRHLP